MGKPRSRRARQPRIAPLEKLALSITTPEQARHGLKAVDIANHTDEDQREMVRLRAAEPDRKSDKARQTVRKLTRVEKLRKAGIITVEQFDACEWYAAAYELGFSTVGCTANYEPTVCGISSNDLLARYKAQSEARKDYYYARQAIPDNLLWLFEAVVLETGDPPVNLNRPNRIRFSMAAYLLQGQIGHLLRIAA
jgi:hypothetical protein